jgi:hypothetical protein
MSQILAAFPDEKGLRSALPALRDAALGRVETYTPRPLEEGPSWLPVAIFVAGVVTMAASLALQSYADVVAYPLDIGGRPLFSWPSFIPIALENGILAAIATGFFGYLIVNRMPTLYEPIDESIVLPRASRDLWCVVVRTDRRDAARQIFERCGAENIEVLAE